jgi:hypothetical protein
MTDQRDEDIALLLDLVVRAHVYMVTNAQWDWVVRADAALALIQQPPPDPFSTQT